MPIFQTTTAATLHTIAQQTMSPTLIMWLGFMITLLIFIFVIWLYQSKSKR